MVSSSVQWLKVKDANLATNAILTVIGFFITWLVAFWGYLSMRSQVKYTGIEQRKTDRHQQLLQMAMKAISECLASSQASAHAIVQWQTLKKASAPPEIVDARHRECLQNYRAFIANAVFLPPEVKEGADTLSKAISDQYNSSENSTDDNFDEALKCFVDASDNWVKRHYSLLFHNN